MKLEATILAALELTGKVSAALDSQKVDLCLAALQQRGAAMAAFEAAHREASQADRNACREILEELLAADVALKRKTAKALEKVASDFQKSFGVAGHPGVSSGSQPRTGCLDRKA